MKLQVQKEMVILDVAELRWAKAGDGADGFVDSGSCFQEERSQGSSGVATCLESLKEEAGILRQIIHVISCYNLINVEIHGICSDAGGGNARLYTLFTQGTKVSSGSDHAVSRKVWVFLCSTHNNNNSVISS